MAYRILSIDGGGVRGLYASVLLKRIAEKVPGFLQKVVLFAGTSSGSFMAMGLAQDIQPSEIVSFFQKHAETIFQKPPLGNLQSLWGWITARYVQRGRQDALREIFGDRKIGDLKKYVLIPSFDLDNQGKKGHVRQWKPKFYHNFPGSESDGEERIVDIAMRSSAAPTYFPLYQGFMDGGVVANNPSMAALAQALDAETGGQVLQDIRLLSIGTGFVAQYEETHLNWGKIRWGLKSTYLLFDGMLGVANYQCSRLLGEHYHRLAPVLREAISLDARHCTAELIAQAEAADIGETVSWIEKKWMEE